MSRKRVVHIVPTFELGGVQTGILYSLEELNRVYDYNVLVIGRIDDEWIGSMPSHIREKIITAGATGLLPGYLKAYRVLRRMTPQVIISSLWKSVLISTAYKLFHPKVYLFGFFHNAFPHHFLGNSILKLMTLVQDSGLADSNKTRLFIRKRYHVDSVDVIPFNFNFEGQFNKVKFDPSHIRMAYFGRLTQVKGVERSIEFCRLCKLHGINFSFDLYGGDGMKGFGEDNYPDKIKKRGLEKEVKLKEVLPLSLVLKTMSQYDFLLQLSSMEGMALSVVEAMNCGLVPLVTPVGEISSYSKDGVNALWLEPDFDTNLEQLVHKLKALIEDEKLYERISEAASMTFASEKKYTEALIESIENRVSKKFTME